MTVRVVNPGLSAHHHPDGTVEIYWYEHASADRAAEIILDPFQALDFLRDLTREVSYSLHDALRTAIIGPCGRCRNSRMIQIERLGPGTETVHCPDCAPRIAALRALYAKSTVELIHTGEALQ